MSLRSPDHSAFSLPLPLNPSPPFTAIPLPHVPPLLCPCCSYTLVFCQELVRSPCRHLLPLQIYAKPVFIIPHFTDLRMIWLFTVASSPHWLFMLECSFFFPFRPRLVPCSQQTLLLGLTLVLQPRAGSCCVLKLHVCLPLFKDFPLQLHLSQ